MRRLPSALSTVTTAPSTTAPDASVTLPLIEPVACPTAHCPANDMDTKIACNVLVVDKTALSVIGLMWKEAVRCIIRSTTTSTRRLFTRFLGSVMRDTVACANPQYWRHMDFARSETV